jgi:predicted nucleic acid-binding protein
LNSVLLDTSFLICLSSPSRSHHELAKQYFQRFIASGVTMHLSTIVISEYEVRQRINDLGLENFIVMPFNIDEAITTAKVFSVMHAARKARDERDAVKDDAKLLGQCVAGGITHFATDDATCAQRIVNVRAQGTIIGLPHAINLHDPFWEGWFSEGNQGCLI